MTSFVTFDIDWSPDWMIEDVLAILERHQVKSTWFVTHESRQVAALQNNPLVERGIHPNFMPNSSHGNSEAEVFDYIKAIVPEAVSMRTHGLVQSTGLLLRAADRYGMRLDSSLFLPPQAQGRLHDLAVGATRIRRAPFFWANDLTMQHPSPTWDTRTMLSGDQLRIFDFHPFHVMLNTNDYQLYEALKIKRSLPEWDRDFIAAHRASGPGPATFLAELAEAVQGHGGFLRDLL